MKNARQVCMCKHVGELQFDDLQGTVVVGKTNWFKFIFSVFVNVILKVKNKYT